MELNEAAASELGLDQFQPDGGQNPSQILFQKDEAQNLLNRIKNTEGANILSAPRIQTASGIEGSVSMTQSFKAPNGHDLSTGPVLAVLPSITADFDGVNVALKTDINLRTDKEIPKL